MAKTKKAAAPASNGANVSDAHVVDIPHEEVNPVNALANPEEQIKKEIAKFNIAEAGIAELKEKYGQLMISGPEDKAGYKAVREAWSDVRSKRTGLEKKGLELRNQYKVITSAISKEEDRLVDLITPLEEDLYSKWKKVDDEKEAEKKRLEEEEQARLMERINELMGLGMVFRDGFYVCGETISMDVATLRSLPADQYDKLKTAVQAKAAEIAEELSKKLAEEEEKRQQFQKQQEELKRQQDELKRQQDELKQQQEEIAKQQRLARELRYKNRLSQLSALGMTYNGQYDAMVFEDVNVDNKTEINLLSDDEWATLIEKITPAIAERKQDAVERAKREEEERQALENKKRFIGDQLLGYNFSYTAQSFTFENSVGSLELIIDELLQLSEPDINARIDKFKQQVSELREKQAERDDKRKKDEEAQRRQGLKDKELWEEQITLLETDILKIVPGQYKTKPFQQKAQKLLEGITELLNGIK